MRCPSPARFSARAAVGLRGPRGISPRAPAKCAAAATQRQSKGRGDAISRSKLLCEALGSDWGGPGGYLELKRRDAAASHAPVHHAGSPFFYASCSASCLRPWTSGALRSPSFSN